jgi:ribosomal protein S18 acetylase RimI-like enzyme
MVELVTSLGSRAASQAPQLNLHDFDRYLRNSATTEFHSMDRVYRWLAPLVHPWFRGVLCDRPATDGDIALVDEQIAYFRSAGAPGFSWWLEPGVKGTGWEQMLNDRGFSFSNDTPGMAIELDSLTDERTLPQGLRIETVDESETLRTWAAVCGEGFGFGGDPNEGMYRTLQGIGLDLPMRNYLGYLDGQPVATSSLYLGAGVAGVYMVATLEAARGKGVGAAMTLAPLSDGRDQGYRVGILQSSAMGFPVYERLGFRTVCQIENYYISLSG